MPDSDPTEGVPGLFLRFSEGPAHYLLIAGFVAYVVGVVILKNNGNGDTFSGDGDVDGGD